MAAGIAITRQDESAADLRRLARASRDVAQARRLLAIALVMEGRSRTDAATAVGMDRQSLRDWVHRFNADGPAGLVDKPRSGRLPRLSADQLQAFDAVVEASLDLETGGVVRWRCAGLVMPHANTEAMNLHLAEIGKAVAPDAHAALVLDGAGWHGSDKLIVPDNVTLVKLPPYAPELNPIENVWAYLRGTKLAHGLFSGYDDIVNACCQAWNSFMANSKTVRSITIRECATCQKF